MRALVFFAADRVAVLRAVVFFGAALRAVVFFGAALRAVVFFGAALRAVVFFGAAFFAVFEAAGRAAFFGAAFFAPDFAAFFGAAFLVAARMASAIAFGRAVVDSVVTCWNSLFAVMVDAGHSNGRKCGRFRNMQAPRGGTVTDRSSSPT